MTAVRVLWWVASGARCIVPVWEGCGLLDGVGAGFGALGVVFAGVAGNADGADDFAVLDDGDAAFDGDGAFNAENARAYRAGGECILEGFGGALKENSGAGFGDAELGAAELSVIHLLVVDEIAGSVDDGDGHGPIVFAGFGECGGCDFFGFFERDGSAVGIGHLCECGDEGNCCECEG
jgi:hypothetical protein